MLTVTRGCNNTALAPHFYQSTHKVVAPIDLQSFADLANEKAIGETFTRLIFLQYSTDVGA